MTSVEKVTFVKEQSRRWFEWTLSSSWATPLGTCLPLFPCPYCTCALKYWAEWAPWSVKCQEFCWNGSVSPLCQWQGFDRAAGCKHPIITSRPRQHFPVRASLAKSFSRGFAGSCDWQAEQSPTDPAQNVGWKIHSASIVSVWDLPSLCLHCFVLSPVMSWRWISWKKPAFFPPVMCTAETRVLSLPWRSHLILPRQSPGHSVLQGFQPFFLKTSQQLSWQGVPSWCLYLTLLFCVSQWAKGYCCWKRGAAFPQPPPTLLLLLPLALSKGFKNWGSLLICQATKEEKETKTKNQTSYVFWIRK